MTMNDTLAAGFSKIMNAERIGNKECFIKFPNTIMKRLLAIMQEKMYVGEFNEIKDSKGNILKLNLLGNINKVGVIKPRYPVKVKEIEKFEKRYLPAQGFGHLLLSTHEGIMTHSDAKKRKLGGKLLAYVY